MHYKTWQGSTVDFQNHIAFFPRICKQFLGHLHIRTKKHPIITKPKNILIIFSSINNLKQKRTEKTRKNKSHEKK